MKVLVTGGAGFIGSLDNVNPEASFVRLSVLDGEMSE